MGEKPIGDRAYFQAVDETLWRLTPSAERARTMSDRALLRTVKEFRRGILGGRESRSMCFAVCAPLVGFLSLCGVDAELVEGVGIAVTRNHYWLRLPDGRVLDPTADQFNEFGDPLPPVYLGPPAWIHGSIMRIEPPTFPPSTIPGAVVPQETTDAD